MGPDGETIGLYLDGAGKQRSIAIPVFEGASQLVTKVYLVYIFILILLDPI